MRRKAVLSLVMAWLIVGVVASAAARASTASSPASLKAVTLSGTAPGGEVLLRIDGEYSFQTIQATEDTVFVDLKGVRSEAGLPKAGRWPGGLLGGYRLLQYTDAAKRPVVRLQFDVRRGEPFTARQEPAGLRLLFGRNPSSSSASASRAPAASPGPEPSEAASSKPRPESSPSGPVRVSDISIKTGAGGETLVDIAVSRPTRYDVLHLTDPPRLVVDLEGAQKATARKSYPAESPLLKGVRVGQFRDGSPAVVRVVADLVGEPRFDVHAIPGGVRMELKPRTAPSPAVTSEPAPTARAEEEVVVSAQAASPSPESAAPPNAEATTAPAVETPASVDIQNALPVPAGSPEVAAAPKLEAPAPTPEAMQAARAARVLVGKSELVAAVPQEQGPGAEQEQPKYTGEPISLNLKDVDLKDFFRLIHEISGLNIIVDPNVTGTVTLVLDAVPWDQALDIVLKNNRLGRTLEGNVLRIARLDTLTAEQEAAVKLAAAREEAQPLVTVFRPVNYAKANTIATMLKSWVGGGALSRRGNVLVDERTNTLIVSDIQTQIPIIESIIGRLDKKAKQVSIEARIVRANADFSRTLATTLSAAYTNLKGNTVMAAGTGTGATAGSTSPADLEVTTPTVSGFGVYAISNAGARYVINAAIAAEEFRGQAKTISRPTIVTQNNVPGSVRQGTMIPIQTTINNTISITYQNATLELRVTPQVTEDGNIFLDVNVTNATPGAVLTGAGPSINTQQATTQVLVPDGGTVVFGGVTVTTRSRSATQVPLLGSIPIIGNLFKSSVVTDNDQELLFFVTPKVLPG